MHAGIPCRNRPVLNRRHSHKAANLLWRLFATRANHPSPFRIQSRY